MGPCHLGNARPVHTQRHLIYNVQIAWTVRNVLIPKGGLKLATKTLLWRGTLIGIPYIYSLSSIAISLRIGLSFSSSNDIFFLTTLVCILSLFFDWAYNLLLVIPLYGVYKFGRLLYLWALTPEPEPEFNTKRAEKSKRKFKTIRV